MQVQLTVPHFGRAVIHPFFNKVDNVKISDKKAAGASCGTCSQKVKQKVGDLLYCTCKGKYVKSYNICDKHA
jgi:hypothetical protein